MWFFQSAIDAAMKMVRVCGVCGTKMFGKIYQKDRDMPCPRCKTPVPPKDRKHSKIAEHEED